MSLAGILVTMLRLCSNNHKILDEFKESVVHSTDNNQVMLFYLEFVLSVVDSIENIEFLIIQSLSHYCTFIKIRTDIKMSNFD